MSVRDGESSAKASFSSLVNDDFRELGLNVHQIDSAIRLPAIIRGSFPIGIPRDGNQQIHDCFCRAEPDSLLA